MKSTFKLRYVLMALIIFALAPSAHAATTPLLGTAATFGILAGTYTNTTPGTAIYAGDLGYTTGPATEPRFVGGTDYGSGAPYPTAHLTDAVNALSALNAEPCDFSFGSGTDLSSLSQPLAPGVYCVTGAMTVGAGLDLGPGTYVFRSTGALTVPSNVNTDMGGFANEIFWTPGAATTIAGNVTFTGTVIDDANAITVGNNVTWFGRAISLGAGTITTDNDTFFVPHATVISATTEDIDGDGKIDHLKVVYSEPVTDPGYEAVSVAGYNSTALDDASFYYPSATFCQSGANSTPTITGLPGGNLSATPVGLSVNPSTGTIRPVTSALGVYTLTYNTNGSNPNTSSITITIANTDPSATFGYASSSYSQDGTDPSPVFDPGASAGVFSAPAGLVFTNVNTGEIDLKDSSPGTYLVTNTIPVSGSCSSAVATTSVTITQSATVDTSISYPIVAFGGGNDTGATPALTWTGSGTDVVGRSLEGGALLGGSANATDGAKPILLGFSSTFGGTYGPGSNITIEGNYSEDISSGSITIDLNNTVTGLTLSTIGGDFISGTYTVGAAGSGQSVTGLDVSAIEHQSVSDGTNTNTDTTMPATTLASDNINIDTTVSVPATPVITITSPTVGDSVNASRVIAFTNSDVHAPQCSVNAVDWTACTSSSTTLGDIPQFAGLSQGLFTLHVRDVDQATGTDQVGLQKDTVAPTDQDSLFLISVSKQGGAAVAVATSTGSEDRWFAPSGTIVFISGATITKAVSTTATSILAPAMDGEYKLFVIDAAGNISSPSTATLTVDNTVPSAPAASPVAGTYTSSQSIILSSANSTSIRYTTDGSDPTTCSSGTLYVGALFVPSSITIKAVGCNDAGGISASSTFVYVITSVGGGGGGSGGGGGGNSLGSSHGTTSILIPGSPATIPAITTAAGDVLAGITTDASGHRDAPSTAASGPSPFNESIQSISKVQAGWLIRSKSYSTVYYVDAAGKRHAFWNAQTYFTWSNSWNDVIWVTDATLPTLPLGSPILPKPGAVLVKADSDPNVYKVDVSATTGAFLLRHISSESVAASMYGPHWADYVIDLDPTIMSNYGYAADVTSAEAVDLSLLKTRALINELAK